MIGKSAYELCSERDSDFFGEPCQCASCRPVDYCVDDTCLECDGPVIGCTIPEEVGEE